MNFEEFPASHFSFGWKHNLNELCSIFGLNFSTLNKCLRMTNSVIAGGSLVCALTSFCTPQEYDGDIDIFIPYKPRDLPTTELLFDLCFSAAGYKSEKSESKFKKPEECPICYRTEDELQSEFKSLQPCQHWCCEECIELFTDNKCPLCRTIMGSSLESFHTEEERKNASEYESIISIKHFHEYKHPVTHKTIQCIYVQNILRSIRTFDLSICKLYYNGTSLYVHSPENLLAFKGYINHPSELTEKQKNRVEKYRKRGFGICSIYSIHFMEFIHEFLPIEKDVINHVVYPYLKHPHEKPRIY